MIDLRYIIELYSLYGLSVRKLIKIKCLSKYLIGKSFEKFEIF